MIGFMYQIDYRMIKTPKFFGKVNWYYLTTSLLDWMRRTGGENQKFCFDMGDSKCPLDIQIEMCWYAVN